MSDKVCKHIYLSGKVQGVGFRASARRKGNELQITGWIRNLFDGRVEAVLEGNKKNVEQMINYLRNGPRFARVEDIEKHSEDYSGDFNNFRVKR